MAAPEILSPPEKVSMSDDWFDIADTSHFWMKWRLNTLLKNKKLLPPAGTRVFEIGCGNCVFASQLENEGYIVDGCDLNEHAISKGADIKGRKLIYNIFDLNKELTGKYDAVFLMDVVEHITDDKLFLQTAARYAKPGGLIVINVPAHQQFYSNYDTVVGHIRRYNKQQMRKTIEDSGLEWVEGNYWGLPLIPVIMIRKILLAGKNENVIQSGFKPPGMLANALLQFMQASESILPFPMPNGTSLLAFARVKK